MRYTDARHYWENIEADQALYLLRCNVDSFSHAALVDVRDHLPAFFVRLRVDSFISSFFADFYLDDLAFIRTMQYQWTIATVMQGRVAARQITEAEEMWYQLCG